MTSKQYLNALRLMFQFGCIVMVFEALFHASGIRTAGAEDYWPIGAVIMLQLFVWLWSSVSFFVATVLYYVQKHLEQSKQLIFLISLAAFVHSLILLYLSLTPYTQLLPAPNLYAWIPFYPWWLRGEATILLAATGFIWYGKWKKFI